VHNVLCIASRIFAELMYAFYGSTLYFQPLAVDGNTNCI
jgi:hypothetical protein